ncbi:hypothetical protein EV197_2709 [Aquimarina brevivitae]|uniref:Signal transduction histidine kinase internal region domain-containing protein n=2 Tax=Aquimarina brevivitae TaxID=323412 RepID=A0A4Q7NYN3_9FLAO|nr:hypothetical protein EV197_2709 [Aquimarina brevivitae]
MCYTYFFGYDTNNKSYAFYFSLFLMPVTVGTTYYVIDQLIPNYLLQKKYTVFILYAVYTAIISAFFIVLFFFYGVVFLSSFSVAQMAPMTRSPFFLFIAVYFVIFIASAIRLLQYNYITNQANQKLQTKILEAQLQVKQQELNYLKMQIHPHFLFNTLNTLYGFALQKSEEAPDMILKLSNLLDYLLYQVDKPLVSLEQELHHIKDYISLEKMRFRDTLDVTINAFCDNNSIEIPPMLLIPFIENSFKHGSLVNGKLSIVMNLECHQNSILFSIKNSIDKQMDTTNAGIGLKNVRKRLELVYPNQHQLSINQTKDWFEVNLHLKN